MLLEKARKFRGHFFLRFCLPAPWPGAQMLLSTASMRNQDREVNVSFDKMSGDLHFKAGMSKLFHKGPCGCRFLFQPVKSTQFDQSTFWRLRSVD